MHHPAIRPSAKRHSLPAILAACLCAALLAASGASPAIAVYNNPPTLDPISSRTVFENSAAAVVPLTGISDGEIGGGQALTVSAASSNPSILPDPAVTYTSPDTTGSLSFAPAPNMIGEVDVTVTVKDNGGTLGGGVDSFSQVFHVSVTPVSIYLPSISKPGLPWTTALQENFEGNFPGNWVLSGYKFDGVSWQPNTEYLWGKRTCQEASGSYVGWAVGGGSLGSNLSCGGGYPDNTQTWMVTGPIDLSRVQDGLMTMKIWTDIEPGYDDICWGVSLDNKWFDGQSIYGSSGGWTDDSIDLKDVDQLKNVTGQPRVWIGIWFISDFSNRSYKEGVAVDDLVLSTCPTANGCTGSAPVARSPTPCSSSFPPAAAVESRH